MQARVANPAAAEMLKRLGLEPESAPPASQQSFPDGGIWRVEIPSVEGPEAVDVVLAKAEQLNVPVHRISQGSGVTLLSDSDITDMVQACQEHHVELALFARPGANWDVGASSQSSAGSSSARARGASQLTAALLEIERGCELGVRTFLTADEGVLWYAHRLRAQGNLPPTVQFKVSIMSAPTNPASLVVNASLGADTVNVPSDLSVHQLAGLREASPVTLDVYLEAPDNIGGFVRHHDVAEIIQAAAPIYIKFGLRNAPDIYPAGTQLRTAALDSAVERVRRARLGLDALKRTTHGITLPMSALGMREQPQVPRFSQPAHPPSTRRTSPTPTDRNPNVTVRESPEF